MNYMEKLELIAKLMNEVDAYVWRGAIYTGRDDSDSKSPRVILTGTNPNQWKVTGKPS